MQQLLQVNYPITGLLSGQFHARGTRAQPAVTGLFDLSSATAYGFSFNSLRGQLNLQPDSVRISDAELRFFAPGTEANRGAGIVTGSAAYTFTDKSISADLVGASLPIENFKQFANRPLSPLADKSAFASKPVARRKLRKARELSASLTCV